MKTDILFEEVQRSSKKLARDFFKIMTGLFMVALAFNLIWQKGYINQLTTILFVGLLICALTSIFISIKMVTQIRNDGIYVRFPPFQPSFERYSWDNIQELYIREFDAISEYSSWGIRFGAWGVKFGISGKGYILWGNKGVQIVLHDNSKILISTQRPDEIANVLNELKK
ncbi:MAG: hypothetical protein ACXWWC_06620 [Chitinophagaceae bacterium]